MYNIDLTKSNWSLSAFHSGDWLSTSWNWYVLAATNFANRARRPR